MKRNNILLIFGALILLTISSCSKTEEFQHNTDSALQIESVSGISPFALTTKAVITGNTLPNSDAATGIGIFVTAANGGAYDGHDSGYTNVKYTFDGSKWSTQSPIYLSDNDGKLYGYFPYNPDATDLRAIPVESSLNGTDYLYANPMTVNHSEKNVTLQMKHALSRLHLTIKKGANFTAEATLSEITLKSAAIDATGTMDLTTGVITASKKSGEIGIVELATDGEITAQGIEKDILLVPADNSEGKKDIAIILLIGGKSAGITLSGENGIDIRSGIQNKVTLTIEDTGIKVTGVGVGEWGEGGSRVVQVQGHTVTVKFADDVVPHDILTDIYTDGANVKIEAFCKSSIPPKCTLTGTAEVSRDKLGDIHSFTISNIGSDVTATVGYAKVVNVKVSSNNDTWGSATFEGNCYEGETITFSATNYFSSLFVGWQDMTGNILSTQKNYSVTLTSDLTVIAVFNPTGALSGVFTVSDDGKGNVKKVRFLSGLIFHTIDDSGKINWKFFLSQSVIDSQYKGSVSLFYWSQTSSVANAQYYSDNTRSAGDVLFTNVDNESPLMPVYKTLSQAEWNYLFTSRSNATNKYGFATVNGVHGVIILPDTFTDPKTNKNNEAFVSYPATGWTANEYTLENWNDMESAGAVFLPAAGYRKRSEIEQVGTLGHYWSSTPSGDVSAYCLDFSEGSVNTAKDIDRSTACAIRLVTEVK